LATICLRTKAGREQQVEQAVAQLMDLLAG
jgi:hypothetical protein